MRWSSRPKRKLIGRIDLYQALEGSRDRAMPAMWNTARTKVEVPRFVVADAVQSSGPGPDCWRLLVWARRNVLDLDVHSCQDGPKLITESVPRALSSNLEDEAVDVRRRIFRIVAMFRQDLLSSLEERSGGQSVPLGKSRVDGLPEPDDLGDESDVYTGK